VQQCGACNTVIELNPEATLPQLCSFAQWLPKHAALVRGITATAVARERKDVYGLAWKAHWEVAEQLLQHGLHAAASQPHTAPVLASAAMNSRTAAATPSQQLGQRRQGLRLTFFRSDYASTAGVLAALPAHSLTFLELESSHSLPAAGSALPDTLAQLTNLRCLRLENGCQRYPIPGSCLQALSQLKQLTHLCVEGYWGNQCASASAAAAGGGSTTSVFVAGAPPGVQQGAAGHTALHTA
jgi:hypothetical protein